MIVGWNPVAVTIDKPYLKITANGDLIRNNMIILINKQSYFSYAVYPFLIAWHTCEELVNLSTSLLSLMMHLELERSLIHYKSYYFKEAVNVNVPHLSHFNPLQPGVVCLYPLKTSENLKVF